MAPAPIGERRGQRPSSGDFRGDFVAPIGALLHSVGSKRNRKLLKNKGLEFAPLHGVQGAASSNPPVPTSSSKGRQ